MSTTGVILTFECSILAVFILFMVGALIFNVYKWKYPASRNISNKNDSTSKKYIVLPHTSAESIQLRRSVKQVNNDLNEKGSSNRPILETSADAGRLYFSLKYEDVSSILVINLIKGENLPLVTKDETKAFVSVRIISEKMDGETKQNTTINTSYQRTYKFPLSKEDFFSKTIRFEISRFDRFSRKYNVGYVMISLDELLTHGVDISREAFFTRSICPWKCSKMNTKKRRRSDTSQHEKSQVLRRVRKESKIKQRRPQVLWHKLSHAVHAGIYQGLIRGRHESLQWDPFLIIQKYEHGDSDENSCPEEEISPSKKRQHDFSEEPSDIFFEESSDMFTEESSNVFPKVFDTITESSAVSSQPSDSSPENVALKAPLNRDFYRLVHSPQLFQSDSSEPVTSWSIPETFRFPPSPSAAHQTPSSAHQKHDRLHKLTSLSSSYRKRVLRKSRKRSRRSQLRKTEPLHRLLYLDRDAQRSIKRLRACDSHSA